MGLLDDAIRDHLDLKRRRGADPAEIERAERDALGPVRREPIASEEGTENALPSSGLAAAPPDAEVPRERSGEIVPPAVRYGGGLEEDDAADGEDWDDYEEDEYEDEDDESLEPGHPDLGPESSAHVPDPGGVHPDQPRRPHPDDDLEATQVHDIAPARESDRGTEDVLEETPDFLQDTPDHDRLWFEQRPPRDFDFEE